MTERRTFAMERFVDARGTLVAAEFSNLPFEPKRVFIVTGPEGGSERGHHVVRCEQLLMLVTGAATVRITASGANAPEEIRLSVPGECVRLRPGEYIEYRLPDAGASVIVFASEAYRPPIDGDAK